MRHRYINSGLLAGRCMRGVAFLVLALGLYGCASGKKFISHQFKPDKPATAEAVTLAPVSLGGSGRSAPKILREAEEAYEAAQQAKAAGNKEATRAQYRRVLDFLYEADLEPAMFPNLQEEARAALGDGIKGLKQSEKPLLTMPFPIPGPVYYEIDDMRTRYPKKFQWGLDNSRRYASFITRTFGQAGIPEDLVWLAMVESMFDPDVNSPAGAGGMWQFMPATGYRFGLQRDAYVDQRYHWKKSTLAAVEYMKKLRSHFDGSWELAVSAYNMGEGGLSRAIAANGGQRDFWTLIQTPPASERIRTETKKYYPRLLAYILVTRSPEQYGFTLKPDNPENTATVTVSNMYALEELDAAMGYSQGTLSELNPELIKDVTPPGRAFELAVPEADKERLAGIIDKTQPIQPKNASRYAKNKGGKLLANDGPREEEKAAAAPEKLGRNAKEAKTEEPKAAAESAYVVKRGDSLRKIATAHGRTIEELQALNKLGKSAQIRVGQTLVLSKAAAEKPMDGQTSWHQVSAGDTPEKIARSYNMDFQEFLALNRIQRDSVIRTGQKLRVAAKENTNAKKPAGKLAVAKAGTAPEKTGASPAKKTAAAEVRGKSATHTVAKGDTASSIASRYGMSVREFLQTNSLTDKSVLKTGQIFNVTAPMQTATTTEKPVRKTGAAKSGPAQKSAPAAKKPAGKAPAKR